MPAAPSFSSFPERPRQTPAQDPAWKQGGLEASTSAGSTTGVPVFESFPERAGKVKDGKKRRDEEREREGDGERRRRRSRERERQREDDEKSRKKHRREDSAGKESRRRYEYERDEERRRRKARRLDDTVSRTVEVCTLLHTILACSFSDLQSSPPTQSRTNSSTSIGQEMKVTSDTAGSKPERYRDTLRKGVRRP